ncbi:diguanylate cyclase [Octadecabacter sp.]|nr:diguanylate cyclase [Octadecabacter sp.]
MEHSVEYIAVFVEAVSLIMALVLMVSLLSRKARRFEVNTVLTGLLFSFAVYLTMSDPIDLGSGGVHDMRSLLIGTAAALLGPIVGLMTLATGLMMRWTTGGTGMVPGLVGMVFTYSGALLWRRFVLCRGIVQWKRAALLGVFISLHVLALFLFPVDIWRALFPKVAPMYLAANVFGAMLLSYLISGELSFLSEAETSKIAATTDHLTGLLNRRGLDLVYPSLAQLKGPQKGCALLYFDIDRFKTVNDTYGHAVGDDVLKFVSEEISQNLRPSDLFARIGGDEFTIVLSRIDVDEAERIAKRCCAVVHDAGFTHNGDVLDVSISIGAIWMVQHSEIDEALHRADEALYAAKVAGRNTVVFKSWLGSGKPLGSAIPA